MKKASLISCIAVFNCLSLGFNVVIRVKFLFFYQVLNTDFQNQYRVKFFASGFVGLFGLCEHPTQLPQLVEFNDIDKCCSPLISPHHRYCSTSFSHASTNTSNRRN